MEYRTMKHGETPSLLGFGCMRFPTLADGSIDEEKAEALSSPEPDRAFHFQTIEFKNVCFRYPGTHKYILKNCSFLLSADKAYALVGENGSGKSTIIKLLTGLYSEYEGTIKINGKSIKEYSYAELNSLISVAFQD